MPFKLILNCMNEVHNCKAIYQGIIHTSKIFPDSYVIMAFIGIVKGNGPGFTRMLERLIRGSWSLSVLEFMHPTHTTKISTFATIVFIANRHLEYLMISQSFVFFCVSSACIYFRLSALLLDLVDPFSPFENVVCLLLFGGIWDALSRALSMDEHQYPRATNQIRAKAMKVDLLSRTSHQLAADKQLVATSETI